MEASYYKQLGRKEVQCLLCPHNCLIKPGKMGKCNARLNKNGILISENYEYASALSLDPIEKKPLYHFHPGSKILSLGSFGCNLTCKFCQNHEISQLSGGITPGRGQKITASEIIIRAKTANENIGLAFTYNEPLVWFEYMRDIAVKAKKEDLLTAVISNGFFNNEPLTEIIGFTDAFNIDLKAYDNIFYKEQTGGSLKPVMDSLVQIAESGKHLEITMLIIPGLNDNQNQFSDTVKWINRTLGPETILHLSRYFPRYKSSTASTPSDTLVRLHNLAREYLKFVYIGNILSDSESNTYCPDCGVKVTSRTAYSIRHIESDDMGNCNVCGKGIYRHFTS